MFKAGEPHGTELGPLSVGDNYVTTFVGGPIPVTLADVLVPILYFEIPCSDFIQGIGVWFCLILVCQKLLIPQGRP